ncbi:MAG: O-antigen ligase family protein [Actinomycetes bacterium]
MSDTITEGDRADAATPTRARVLAIAGDGLALLALVVVFWWLERHDGGRARQAFGYASVVLLVAVPVAVAEVRRLSPVLRGLVAAYGVGWLLALGFALDRAEWVVPTLVLGSVPLVGLVGRRVWRRAWGPAALLALLLVSFGLYTVRSWLQWWGSTMLDFQPLWLALSWRNQSGVLMGAFLLVGLGVALRARGPVRLAGLLVVGVSGAGTWLSSSRGALVFLVPAVAVVLGVELRSRRRTSQGTEETEGTGGGSLRRPALVLAGGIGAAVLVTAGLLALLPAGVASPLGSRTAPEDDASGNTVARLRHMEAAIGMFLDDPLTGKGPGSYRSMSLDHTSPDANLTLSAHDEYAEVLGEGGLAGGGPFVLLHVGLALLVVRRLRTGIPRDDDGPVDLRGAVELGVLGAATLVAAHAVFDFDWLYPALPAFVALGGAVLTAVPDGAGGEAAGGVADEPGGLRAVLAGVPVALLLVLGVAGFVVEQVDGANQDRADVTAEELASAGVPWDAATKLSAGTQLLAAGELELAREVTDAALRWSPGLEPLRRLDAQVAYAEGELGPQELVATLEPGRSRFQSWIVVADALVADDELALAEEVLVDLLPRLERHRAWGVEQSYLDASVRLVALAADLRGCDAARARLDEVLDTAILDGQPDEVVRAIEVPAEAVCGS